MKYSFEFFPPKDDAGVDQLKKTVESIIARTKDISFFSVTYGAGGSTRDRTLDTVKLLMSYGIPVYAHLTCVAQTIESLHEILSEYKKLGVKGIVALRGDIPSGTVHSDGVMKYASDLIRFIRKFYPNFDIKSAAYPEKHPDTATIGECHANSIDKIYLGSSSLITQFCFHTYAIERLAERVCEAHDDMNLGHVTPGVIPVYNFNQFKKFAHRCEAEIPRWMELEFQYADSDEARIEVSKMIFLDQIHALSRNFSHIHIYTLNKDMFGLELPND